MSLEAFTQRLNTKDGKKPALMFYSLPFETFDSHPEHEAPLMKYRATAEATAWCSRNNKANISVKTSIDNRIDLD